MFRRVGLSALVLLAVTGCGRSNVYRYPPPVPVPPDGGKQEIDGGRLDLIDGGVIIPTEPACIPLQVETYILPTVRRPIDVLFVVDDSRSMADNQDALASNFAAFIKAFATAQVDFHLGTVTTDMVSSKRRGKLVPVVVPTSVSPDGGVTFLSPSTPNLSDAFSRMVKVGINGSGNEQGIGAAKAALGGAPAPATTPDQTVITTNAGFVRPEADLGVVFLSDENDHSTETVTSFVSFLKTLKADTSSLSVASIVGLDKSLGCNTGTWKYTQVAHAFGPRGLVSACDPDYASTLEAVSGRLVGTLCIVGLSRPISDDLHIEVRVNGRDWLFFHAAADSIYPNGSIELLPCPTTGGTVEVVYEECPL